MSFYPPKINQKFQSPKHCGTTVEANASGTSATFICGAVLRFSLHIERDTKKILEVKFKTNGCGYLIAAADTLAGQIREKSLFELHSFEREFIESEIISELENFPNERRHCLELAYDALQNALANFRKSQVVEWSGERALICTCFGVSEETVETLIFENSIVSVEEVAAVCGAGSGCGSCRFLIQEIIDSAQFDF